VSWAHERWRQDPSLHIYHYAAYEVTALRRLMGRYAVCEEEVAQLLRAEAFVDLYSVVRQGLLVSTRYFFFLTPPQTFGTTNPACWATSI
jgi:uncharacterized protein